MIIMPSQLPKVETVTLEELMLSDSCEMIALITAMEKKDILSRSKINE